MKLCRAVDIKSEVRFFTKQSEADNEEEIIAFSQITETVGGARSDILNTQEASSIQTRSEFKEVNFSENIV
jgi:hypothetical protein